ncbi:MAG: uracil-DNA glycosylase [Nitrosopumilaceae archaeon]|nr:uracil-DNA glycosylase [Nitrosopumilaceae archaeon]
MSNSIQEIRKKVSACTKCELCETRTNAVPGKGDVNSKVIFVGEAPGRSEDKHGEPFVGSAGKKLTLALESAGISRDSVYITNVVKCRPPNNRVPTNAEREKCSSYLRSEIELIKPKIICVMGNTAFKSLLDGDNITKHRGKIIRKDEQDYFVTIHPAATIYNQELFPILKKDMKKLFKIISSD